MSTPLLCIVVAMDRGGVIGHRGALPWSLPEELAHFRSITLGHTLIMGRRTHASIGHPLDGRRNIVLSRRPGLHLEGCEVAGSFDDAVACAATSDDEPHVIGGAEVFAQALPRATRLVISQVHGDFAGDTRFPVFDRARWREMEREERSGFTRVTLVRR